MNHFKELFEKKHTVEDAMDYLAILHAIFRCLSGEKPGVSTDIAGNTSYGYGKLDSNGFWEFPISEFIVEKLNAPTEKFEDWIKDKDIGKLTIGEIWESAFRAGQKFQMENKNRTNVSIR